ncbi:hypothetical protein [Thermoanaerobacter italicus]|nr:hypothetical protein [Thermoanaerobacter italicus]
MKEKLKEKLNAPIIDPAEKMLAELLFRELTLKYQFPEIKTEKR